MNKRLKKTAAFLLLLTMSISVLSVTAFSEVYSEITENTVSARVVKIIDGDALKVKLPSEKIALVKIIGIDAQGYNNSVLYLTNKILGAEVTLAKDSNIQSYQGQWNYMNVIYNGVDISSDMISKGFAIADASQAALSNYNQLSKQQQTAKENDMEIWSYGVRAGSTIGGTSSGLRSGVSTDDVVNINTATSSQITDILSGISTGLAENIVRYRNNNPFNSIDEIKFVDGVTKAIYDKNKNNITVCTNINKALKQELETLTNITESEADEIISYRRKNTFSNKKDLRTEDIISNSKYEKIEPYISVNNQDTITAYAGNSVINVNKATKEQMTLAGLSSTNASAIISGRANGYTYKNIMEIMMLNDASLSFSEFNQLEDNLHAMTNVNEAEDVEIRSVFDTGDASRIRNARWINNLSTVNTIVGDSVFKKVEAIIYCTTNNGSYVNINTATEEQMIAAGMPAGKARQLIQSRPYTAANELPFDISDYNKNFTLYTNINKAPTSELNTLNNGLNASNVNSIKQYAASQPFGSMEEVKEYFSSLNLSASYNKIKDYIVLR